MTEQQKEQIQRLRAEGLGYLKIAKLLSVSVNTIKTYCRRNDLRIKPVRQNGKPNTGDVNFAICKNCGKDIEQKPGIKRKKFCSDFCRVTWWNSHHAQVNRRANYFIVCANCSNPFTSYGNKTRKYCCHTCYIKSRFRKGGEINDDYRAV